MSRVFPLKKIDEKKRGITLVLNSIKHEVKRVYFLKNITNNKIVRGGHKHKKNHQTLIVINGSVKIKVIYKNKKKYFKIKNNSKNNSLYLRPEDWHEMYDFSNDCVVCVLASEKYLKSDYIYEQN